jgi:type I restriction enzyme M protein
MDITTLENWLWEAACSIRGRWTPPSTKTIFLPLLFYKRLYDVFADEVDRLSREFGDLARELVEGDRGMIRFYIPEEHTWDQVRRSPVNLGERLTDAMKAIARENPELQGVIDRRDFNATEAGQRLLEDESLTSIRNAFVEGDLG